MEPNCNSDILSRHTHFSEYAMNPLSILLRLINSIRRMGHNPRNDAWKAIVQSLDDARTPTQFDTSQRHTTTNGIDAFDDRRVPRDPLAVQTPRLRIVKGEISKAATVLLAELSLAQAIEIIKTLPGTSSNLVSLEIQQRAFACIRAHLARRESAPAPGTTEILLLLARRLGDLASPEQRDQAMCLIEQSLRELPQIELIETLTEQLGQIPAALHQRTLDLIEKFLFETADIPLSQVDILMALTRAVPINGCRQRASALIATGLQRLRHAPAACTHIRHSLVFAYCTVDQGLQLQA